MMNVLFFLLKFLGWREEGKDGLETLKNMKEVSFRYQRLEKRVQDTVMLM